MSTELESSWSINRPSRARPLIVSLHDVAPPFEREIRAQLDALSAAGIERVVLKVVPNWHGQYPLDASPSLVDLLREREAAGSQIVLHGYEHRAVLPLRGRGPSRVRGELFARGAAEFLSLDGETMERRARDGADMVAGVGLRRPDSFCGPGWLLGPGAHAALRRAGMRRTITMWSVVDLETGRKRRVVGIGYMGVGGAHERAIMGLNAIAGALIPRTSSPLKLYLHPQGGALGGAARRIIDLSARLLATGKWEPATFDDLAT